MVRNDSITLNMGHTSSIAGNSQHRVSQPCRNQLRNQLLQQHEDVQLNPNLRKPCAEEESKFCSQVRPGGGRIIECLKNHRKQLSVACHAAIFQIEKEEMDDNAVDFQLVSQCKASIRRLCSNDASKALECLKVFKIFIIGVSFMFIIMDFIDFVYLKVHLDDNSLESDCKEIILARIAEQNLDVRFNSVLTKACSSDISKFCRKVTLIYILFKKDIAMYSKSFVTNQIWDQRADDRELEGQILDCLKSNYVTPRNKNRVSQSCAAHLSQIMEQQALHYQLDPVLVKFCEKDVQLNFNKNIAI